MNTAGGPCDGSSCWRRAPLEVRDARCVTGSWQRCAVGRQVLELFEGCRAPHGCSARQVFRYLPSDDEMSMRLRRSLARILVWTVSWSVSMDCLALMERPLLVKRWSSAGREHLDRSRRLGAVQNATTVSRFVSVMELVGRRLRVDGALLALGLGSVVETAGSRWIVCSRVPQLDFFFAATQRLQASLRSRGGRVVPPAELMA